MYPLEVPTFLAGKRTPLVLLFAGLLLLPGGLLVAFLGGYIANGEAHSNPEEGIPMASAGLAFAGIGLFLVISGVRKAYRLVAGARRRDSDAGNP